MSDDIEDVVVRLRRTRADMIGTDDEEHYFDCHEAAHVIEELRDEITNLNELAKDRYCTMQTEIERLTKGWEGLEYETSAEIASLAAAVNTMHKEAIEQEKHIAKLEGDIQVLKLQRDATHVSRCPNCNNGE
jgi:predicted RNase H-like nuclease (RuvC/YqgF family)